MIKKKFAAFILVSCICLLYCAGCGLKAPAPKTDPSRVPDNVTIEGQAVGGMTVAEGRRVVTDLAKAKDVPPVNAGFDPNTGAIIPERPGQRLNVVATIDALLAAVPGSSITPVYEPSSPNITKDLLERSRTLGNATTPILDNSAGRMVNIRLTVQLINNTVITPEQEFSFLKTTGEPTAERGFEQATVLGEAGKEQGLGGGMCQVSSTLYSAVLAAGLKVTERHAHSEPVSYIPAGKDATIYTDKDFRFVNTTRSRIIIRSFVHDQGSKLTSEIWAIPGA